MAHPGLAVVGIVAIGLIGAGVWLRMDGSGEQARTVPTATGPDPVPTLADVARQEEARQDEAHPAAAGTGEADPVAAAEPGPSAEAVSDPNGEPEPTPEPEPVPDPEPAAGIPETAEPVSEPAPQPSAAADGAQTGKPALDAATPPAAAAPDPAARTGEFVPRTYAGRPVWQADPDTGLPADQIEEARAAAARNMGTPAYFGAVVLSPASATGSGARFFVQGYASLAAAEAEALRQCARFRTDCLVIARLVPDDFDGQRENTLNAFQAEIWAEFMGARGIDSQFLAMHRSFALSPNGGAAWAEMPAAAAADRMVVLRCRTGSGGPAQAAPPGSEHCTIVARRASGGAARP